MAVHGAMTGSLPRGCHRAGTCPGSGGSTIRSRCRTGCARIRASRRCSRRGSCPPRACAGGSPCSAVRSCCSCGCACGARPGTRPAGRSSSRRRPRAGSSPRPSASCLPSPWRLPRPWRSGSARNGLPCTLPLPGALVSGGPGDLVGLKRRTSR